MLSPEEKQIAEFGKAQGKSKEEVLSALTKFRASKVAEQPVETGYSLKEAGGDIAETFQEVGQGLVKTGEDIVTRDIRKPDETTTERIVGTGADVFKGIASTVGNIFKGGAKLASTQGFEDTTKKTIEDIGNAIGDTQYAKDIMATYEGLAPETKTQVDNALGYLEGLATIVTAGQAKNILSNIFKQAEKQVIRGATATGDVLTTAGTATKEAIQGAIPKTAVGVTQIAKEQLERVPRALGKGVDAVKEAQERAMRIQQSAPKVQKAIKAGVDERVINTIAQADEPTRQAYKEMVDIAGETSTSLKPKQQPSIVAGKVAETTFDVLEKERKRIGKELGDEVANLPKGTVVNMAPSMRQVENVLAENGVTITDEGVSFAGKYTKAQRARINELVEIVNELPEQMTAKQVRDMDNLLSQLQRESRMEGLQDIIVEVNGEPKNLFQVFRESYTNQLENINPRIRELNRQYRDAKVLIDDLEDTIFKTGKYESIKGVDQAEFAKTNLRRIMGDAQSSPQYAEILAKMDAQARKLGYSGARADDLIYFAEELRKIYPDTIPKGGFQGGIATGIGGSKVMQLLEGVLGAGKPDLTDQQKALRELLGEVAEPQVKGNVPVSSLKSSTLLDKVKNAGKQFANDMKNEDGFMALGDLGGETKGITTYKARVDNARDALYLAKENVKLGKANAKDIQLAEKNLKLALEDYKKSKNK